MSSTNPGKLRILAGAAAIAALSAVVVAGSGTAADPFQAGQASTLTISLPDEARAALTERANVHLRALGLQKGTKRALARVEDRFEGTTYDEVTELDSKGQPAALLRYATDGSLRTAIAFGWREGKGRALEAVAAGKRGRDLATAIGGAAGEPAVERLIDGTGWRLGWPRVVDGVPVPGDGLRVDLWNDGSLHSLTRSERPLAGRPGQVIGEEQSRQLALDFLRRSFGEGAADLSIVGTDLAWIAPNDAFNPALPDAPSSTLRLARVARVTAGGSMKDRLEGLEIYFDAGDGSVLGGDVLE